MNTRTHRHPLHRRCDLLLGPGALVALAILLGTLGCKQKSSNDTGAATTKGELIPLTNMVAIRAGTFLRIKFPVTITRDFWIGRYEVTQGDFAAVTGRNPSHFAGDSNRPV